MQLENIVSPFDGSVVGQVPVTKLSDIDSVITKSVKAADYGATLLHMFAAQFYLKLQP